MDVVKVQLRYPLTWGFPLIHIHTGISEAGNCIFSGLTLTKRRLELKEVQREQQQQQQRPFYVKGRLVSSLITCRHGTDCGVWCNGSTVKCLTDPRDVLLI